MTLHLMGIDKTCIYSREHQDCGFYKINFQVQFSRKRSNPLSCFFKLIDRFLFALSIESITITWFLRKYPNPQLFLQNFQVIIDSLSPNLHEQEYLWFMLTFNTSYQTPNPKFSLRNFFGIKIDIGDLHSYKSKFFFCEILLLLLIYRINI